MGGSNSPQLRGGGASSPDERDLVMQEWGLGGAALDFSALWQEEDSNDM